MKKEKIIPVFFVLMGVLMLDKILPANTSANTSFNSSPAPALAQATEFQIQETNDATSGEMQNTVPQEEAATPPANAALSLSVHPPVAYVHVKPSETLKHTLIIKNQGAQPLEVSVNITDFKADGKTGQPVLQPGKIFNREANPDLNFGEPFVLQPNKNHSVNLQIDVSDIVPNKEYPLAIMINARSTTEAQGSHVAGTVVSNLIVFIGHDENNQGELAVARLELPKLTDSFTGIRFSLQAKNTGATATLIQGRTIIQNIFQQNIAEYIFYPDFVLANSSRMVRGTSLNPDILDAEGLLDPEKVETLYTQFHYKPPFMVGVYKIHFELGGEQFSQTVIAFPFSIIVLVGLGWMMHWGWKQVVSKVR